MTDLAKDLGPSISWTFQGLSVVSDLFLFHVLLYKIRIHKSKSRDFLARVQFNIGVVSNANAKSAYQSFNNAQNIILFAHS